MRVFLACDDERLRIAMLLLLDDGPKTSLAGITDRLAGLLAQLQATQPDVLILQWDMPYDALANLLAEIHNLNFPPRVVLLTDRPEEADELAAAGADHVVLKNAPPDDLLSICAHSSSCTR